MKHNITISDNDVKFMDESNGNVVLDSSLFPDDVSSSDEVIIHYEEDDANVVHEYTVISVDHDITLGWIRQSSSELTEASFKSIGRRIKNQTKTDEKTRNNVLKLAKREMSPEGKDWVFFMYDPETKKYTKGLTQKDVKSKYQDMVSMKKLTPDVANAIVVTSTGWIVRRGMEDLYQQGIRYSKDTAKVLPTYFLDSDTVDSENAPNENDTETTEPDNDTGTSATTSETDTSDAEAVITDAIFAKVRKIIKATKLPVVTDGGKPQEVDDLSNDELRKLNIHVPGNTRSVGGWIHDLVSAGILKESSKIGNIKRQLLESPIVNLSDKDLFDPSTVDFKKNIRDAQAKEDAARAEAERLKKQDTYKGKYENVVKNFLSLLDSNSNKVDVLETLHDELVPSQGYADTVAGEIVRATMRILYRCYNDGDKFFESYGIETCASSAEYLMDNTDKTIYNMFNDMLLNAFKYEDDDIYEEGLNNIVSSILTYLSNNIDLFYDENENDSREWSVEYVKENQPTYEFELYASDDLDILIDNGYVDSWDLKNYVENELEYITAVDGYEIERPWGHHDRSVTVSNLTKDGYDYIKNDIFRDVDRFWEGLVEEHRHELESDDSDEAYDDDYTEE